MLTRLCRTSCFGCVQCAQWGGGVPVVDGVGPQDPLALVPSASRSTPTNQRDIPLLGFLRLMSWYSSPSLLMQNDHRPSHNYAISTTLRLLYDLFTLARDLVQQTHDEASEFFQLAFSVILSSRNKRHQGKHQPHRLAAYGPVACQGDQCAPP